MKFMPIDPMVAFRNAASDLRAELFPRGPAESALAVAKMKLSFANLRAGMYAMPMLIGVLAIVHSAWSPAWACAAWAVASAVVWLAVWRPLDLYVASGAPEAELAARLPRILLVSTVFALVYAAQGFLFWVPGEPVNHMTIAVLLLASSLAAGMTSSWLPLAASQIVIYVGAPAVLLLADGDAAYALLGSLSVIFALFLAGMVANMHEITSRWLTLEDGKDALIADLRRSNQAKSEFLANMSHELRTPLNAIMGFSEVMKDQMMGPLGKPLYVSYASDIHSSGRHLLDLINDILDLAKIEAGRFTPDDETICVADLIEETRRLFHMRASEADVELRSGVEERLLVRGDRRALKQVLINLVSNSLKFTPQGGSVTIGAKRDHLSQTLVWVADTGAGIRPEDQKTVFQSFGQGRHDIAIKEKGVGLGLAIVKGIVQAHGGEITLDSALGRGTTMTVRLPSGRAAREASLETKAAA